MSDGGSIVLRLALDGSTEVKAALASLGPVGAQAMKQIEQAQHGPNAGLLAISSISKDAKAGIMGLVEEAGTAGRALEHFGAGGLAVAAGIGAAIAAGEKLVEATHQAMEYGEALETAAKAAGVSTTTLQTYRYAVEQTGGTLADADKAMRSFATAFGLAAEGSKRQLAFFEKLGFTPEQMRSFQSVDDALDATVGKIADLGSAAERAAFAKRLGLEPMLPLLQESSAKIASLRNEALQLGIVMDEHVITSLADSEKRFKSASQVIDVQFKQALVDVAPLLVGLISHIADLVRGLDAFLSRYKSAQDLSDSQIASERARLERQQAELVVRNGPMAYLSGPPRGAAAALSYQAYQTRKRRLDELNLESGMREEFRTPEKPKPATYTGNFEPAAPKGPDQAKLAEERAKASDALMASANEEILQAKRGALQAELSSTTDVTHRAELETQLVDLEQQAADAAADRKLVQAEHDLALKKISAEALAQEKLATEATKAANDQAADTKRAEIQRQKDQGLQDQANSVNELTLQGQIDALQAQQGVSHTMEQRRDIALKLFDLEEQLAELKYQEVLASKTATEAEKKKAQQQLDNLQATAGTRREGVSLANPSSPWEDWMNKATAAVSDVHAAIDQMRVDGLDQFNQSLFDSEGRLNSLSDVAHSVFSRMLVDLEQYLLKQAEISIFGGGSGGAGGGGGGGFLSSIFGNVLGSGGGAGTFDGGGWSFPAFAGGGDIRGPGTGTSDSILIAASDGEKIMTARANLMYGPLLDAMNAGQPIHIPHFAAGGTVGVRSGGGMIGGVTLSVVNNTNMNAPGADAAAVQRLSNMHQDWANGEPDRFLGYMRAAGVIPR